MYLEDILELYDVLVLYVLVTLVILIQGLFMCVSILKINHSYFPTPLSYMS